MAWRGLITMLDAAPAARSRIPLYHHPLAGRLLLWHVIAAVADVAPAPDEIVLLHRDDLSPSLPPASPVPLVTEGVAPDDDGAAIRRTVGAGGGWLITDGLLPLVQPASYGRLIRAAEEQVAALRAVPDGPVLAVAGDGLALAAGEDPRAPEGAAAIPPGSTPEGVRVDSRAAFASAASHLRDRIVRRHQEGGVSFLLPETSWVDVDVIIGADTLVYPGVVLEGQTEIGAECVIGPHCRVSDAQLGRGVELKGFNYVTRTMLRNHAVLEPYVRRGYD